MAFSLHFWVEKGVIWTVLTVNKLKWLVGSHSYKSEQNTVTVRNAGDKLDKEAFNTLG